MDDPILRKIIKQTDKEIEILMKQGLFKRLVFFTMFNSYFKTQYSKYGKYK